MKEYEFTLKFTVNDNPEQYVEQLGAEGCTDALIGVGKNGRIALDFIREAKSAYDAISSAVKDVKRAIPDAKLIEASPDFVGLTDIANLLGFTRQNMRKIMVNSGIDFPPPVHEGKSAIWHLSKVLLWLKERKSYSIEDSLIELAKTTMLFNIAKEMKDVEISFPKNINSLVI